MVRKKQQSSLRKYIRQWLWVPIVLLSKWQKSAVLLKSTITNANRIIRSSNALPKLIRSYMQKWRSTDAVTLRVWLSLLPVQPVWWRRPLQVSSLYSCLFTNVEERSTRMTPMYMWISLMKQETHSRNTLYSTISLLHGWKRTVMILPDAIHRKKLTNWLPNHLTIKLPPMT